MNKQLITSVIIFLILIVLTIFAVKAFAAYPSYTSFVSDFANVLSEDFEKKLNTKLSNFEDKTSNEIAVVTVDTTEPETIEEYSIHLAENWKPGKIGKDNGVILLFAMNDRTMRIEVGRGLEGELTDVESKHILDDTIRPEFRAGNIDSGVTKGVDAIIIAISTENATISATSNEGGSGGIIILLIVAGIIIVGGIALSPLTPFGGEGDDHIRGLWVPKKDSKWGRRSFGTIDQEVFVPIVPPIIASRFPSSSHTYTPDDDDNDDSSSINSGSSNSGWGGITFGGGSFSGGGASSSW